MVQTVTYTHTNRHLLLLRPLEASRALEGGGFVFDYPIFVLVLKKGVNFFEGCGIFSRGNISWEVGGIFPKKCYEKLLCKEELYRFSGYRDPLVRQIDILLLYYI